MKSLNNLFQFENIVPLLVSLIFISLAPFTQLGKLSFYVLLLIAIFFFIKNFKSHSTESSLRIIFFCLLAWFSWTLLTNLLNGVPEFSVRSFWRREAFIISMIPLFYLIRRFPLNEKILVLVLIPASFTIGARLLYEISYLGGVRLTGGEHPIQLASIAALVLIILTSALLYCNLTQIVRSLILLCICVLLASIVYSAARGVWVALPVLFLSFLLLSPIKLTVKSKFVVFSLIIVSTISLYFIPPIEKRVDQTIKNVTTYLTTPNVEKTRASMTSIGTRFEMWKAAWSIFTEHPLIGVGLGGYKQAAKKYQKKFGYGNSAYAHYHPHNQYLSELSTKGLPGLVLFLLFLGSMLRYFILGFKREKEMRWAHLAGLQGVLLILILCLSNATFEAKSMVLAMAVYFALLFSYTSNQEEPEMSN